METNEFNVKDMVLVALNNGKIYVGTIIKKTIIEDISSKNIVYEVLLSKNDTSFVADVITDLSQLDNITSPLILCMVNAIDAAKYFALLN